MSADIRKQLTNVLKKIRAEDARLIEQADTDIKIHPASFLKQFKIYEIKHFGEYKPILFYVGYGGGQEVYHLTADAENYERMSKADGVALEGPEAAGEYVATYLEVTRSMSELFYLVNSVGEMRYFPNLSEAEQEVQTDIEAQYGGVVGPPQAEPLGEGYEVTIYAVREQSLERQKIRVGGDGEIMAVNIERLAEDLPLVYGG